MVALAFKEMRFFKLKYLLIGFILFFIALLVFMINGLANGLSADNASSIQTMSAQAFYMNEDASARLDRSAFTKEQKEQITKLSTIDPLGVQMVSLEFNQSKIDMTLMGIEFDSFLHPEVTEGKPLSKHHSHAVVVEEKLKEEGVNIGDTFYEEQANMTLKVVGFTKGQTYSHTPVAFINVNGWEDIMAAKGHVFYNAFVTHDNEPLVKEGIDSQLGDGDWIEQDQVIQNIPGYSAEQTSLYMMLSFLIVIAVFVLGAFFYIMTIQKMNQFGILKALGAKNSYLISLTMVQVVLVSVASIGLALICTQFIQEVLPTGIPFMLNTSMMIKLSGVLFLVSLFGSLLSSYNIVQADPLTAMGRAES
ncbi:ABC transporter permease [Metabacillus iocasae]|uniref:Putative hemin transport system permease protein HrtB n=1 Tax=Priestia iocasae TaxID=2291674 RepID=A0ABS2QU94_9BACI|nr:ABC transporter permease [Metabacillus iocasae]MBM7703063.1 putative ABC transport system permease protein [Metabacillus iocasae]